MAKNAKIELSEIENATQILHELQNKYREVTASGAADTAEMESVSYLAHTGNEKASAKLEALEERANRRAHELESLTSAISVAQRKLAESQHAEAQAIDRKRAEEAREIADRIDSLFVSADKHLALAFDALKAADGRIEELHRLGFEFPTAIQVRTNALFALQTYLMQLPKYWWNELNHGGVRFLAPHERRTFSQLWARMAEPISRNIDTKLNQLKGSGSKAA